MVAPGVSRAMVTLELVVSTLSWMIFGMVSVGFVSMSYRHFAKNPALTPRPQASRDGI